MREIWEKLSGWYLRLSHGISASICPKACEDQKDSVLLRQHNARLCVGAYRTGHITMRHQPYSEAWRWQHCALGIQPGGRKWRHHKDRRKMVGDENRKMTLRAISLKNDLKSNRLKSLSKSKLWTTKKHVTLLLSAAGWCIFVGQNLKTSRTSGFIVLKSMFFLVKWLK